MLKILRQQISETTIYGCYSDLTIPEKDFFTFIHYIYMLNRSNTIKAHKVKQQYEAKLMQIF